MSNNLKYVEAEDISAHLLIADSEKPCKLSIIDVRNPYEYNSGHIKGAEHYSVDLWEDDNFVDGLIVAHKEQDKLVCHCQMSQQRGPYCASRLIERLNVMKSDDSTATIPEVYVLQGGFRRFNHLYGLDPQLIESSSNSGDIESTEH